MTDPLDLLLSRLDGVRQSGERYVARCPAHQDKSPSLSLSRGKDGRGRLWLDGQAFRRHIAQVVRAQCLGECAGLLDWQGFSQREPELIAIHAIDRNGRCRQVEL